MGLPNLETIILMQLKCGKFGKPASTMDGGGAQKEPDIAEIAMFIGPIGQKLWCISNLLQLPSLDLVGVGQDPVMSIMFSPHSPFWLQPILPLLDEQGCFSVLWIYSLEVDFHPPQGEERNEGSLNSIDPLMERTCNCIYNCICNCIIACIIDWCYSIDMISSTCGSRMIPSHCKWLFWLPTHNIYTHRLDRSWFLAARWKLPGWTVELRIELPLPSQDALWTPDFDAPISLTEGGKTRWANMLLNVLNIMSFGQRN